MSIAKCSYVRMPSGRSDILSFDLSALSWNIHGPMPGADLKDQALDLIEVSRIVHEIDRSMPRRISTERTVRFDVRMPVRKPTTWKRAANLLSELLYVQGGIEWTFSFTPRGSAGTSLDTIYEAHKSSRLDRSPSKQVILFSGGLDSTSGLALLRDRQRDFVLVGAYSRNLLLQQQIAAALGYENLIQIQGIWSGAGAAKIGGQFQHRSFYYLSLAASFLDALGGRTIYQFENGPLALAIPPAPLYRMTRHAHPAVHRAAENLFRVILGREIKIENPFLSLTKRQAMKWLKESKQSAAIARTETCWNIRATTVVGAGAKSSTTPCGTCIPCIVRRAATGAKEGKYAVDLMSRSSAYVTDPVVRVHLDAYLAFARRVSAKTYGFGDLLLEMPAATEAAIFDQNAISPGDALKLYKRFASEILDVFGRQSM